MNQRQTEVRHIYIIGNSGSGKSSLAKRLEQDEGREHIDLDPFAWAEVIGVRRPVDDAVAELRSKLAKGPAVIEGMYSDLVEEMAADADLLVWLDLPVDRCLENCKKRPFEPHKWASSDDQDAFLPQLLTFVREYPRREDELGRAAHARLFDEHPGPKWTTTTPLNASAPLPF